MLTSRREGFLKIYLLLSVVEITSNLIFERFQALHYIAKPAMLIVLSVYFFVETEGIRSRRTYLMQAALFFAWLGDVFLMFEGGQWFQVGLGAFLMMQLGYVFVFRNLTTKSKPNYFLMALVLIYALGVFMLILPNLEAMKIPVILYLSAISAMVLTTLFRQGKVSDESFRWVFVGAVLFMISDSLIAIEKFYTPIPLRGIWVMGTYLAGQYLIVEGLLKEIRGGGK